MNKHPAVKSIIFVGACISIALYGIVVLFNTFGKRTSNASLYTTQILGTWEISGFIYRFLPDNKYMLVTINDAGTIDVGDKNTYEIKSDDTNQARITMTKVGNTGGNNCPLFIFENRLLYIDDKKLTRLTGKDDKSLSEIATEMMELRKAANSLATGTENNHSSSTIKNDVPAAKLSPQQSAEAFLSAWKSGKNIDEYLAGQLLNHRAISERSGNRTKDELVLMCALKEYRNLKYSGDIVYKSNNSFAETKAAVFTIDAIQSIVGRETLTFHIYSEGPEMGKLIHIEGSD